MLLYPLINTANLDLHLLFFFKAPNCTFKIIGIRLLVKMEALVDMFCLLVQLLGELQLNLKTNNIQNSQKIRLCGRLTTKDLKKPHSSRWIGGKETQRWAEK